MQKSGLTLEHAYQYYAVSLLHEPVCTAITWMKTANILLNKLCLFHTFSHTYTHTCYHPPPPQHTDGLKAHIVQILNALNPDIDNADAAYVAAADGIVQLETNLAMVSY